MAVAPEEIQPTPNLTDRDTLAKLNGEGRTPSILLMDLSIIHNEGFSASTQAEVLIPPSAIEPEQRRTITLEEARQISALQRELMSHVTDSIT